MTNEKTNTQYRPVCIECGQAGLWQGRRGADIWASGHEQGSGHPVRLETRNATEALPALKGWAYLGPGLYVRTAPKKRRAR